MYGWSLGLGALILDTTSISIQNWPLIGLFVLTGVRWQAKDDDADLYDARMREWYIEAATDPKDIMILIDNSGSMMGQKREIARHTINTILETLSPNDFVNIIHFSNDSRPIVRCFNDSLVQVSTLNKNQTEVFDIITIERISLNLGKRTHNTRIEIRSGKYDERDESSKFYQSSAKSLHRIGNSKLKIIIPYLSSKSTYDMLNFHSIRIAP